MWLNVQTGSQFSPAFNSTTQNNIEFSNSFIQPSVMHWSLHQWCANLTRSKWQDHQLCRVQNSSGQPCGKLALHVLVQIGDSGGVVEPTTVSVVEGYHERLDNNCKCCQLCQPESSVHHFVLPLLASHGLSAWDCTCCFGKKAQYELSLYVPKLHKRYSTQRTDRIQLKNGSYTKL